MEVYMMQLLVLVYRLNGDLVHYVMHMQNILES